MMPKIELNMDELENVTGGAGLTPDQMTPDQMWAMLSASQKSQLRACTSAAQVKNLAKRYFISLTDSQAQQVLDYAQSH